MSTSTATSLPTATATIAPNSTASSVVLFGSLFGLLGIFAALMVIGLIWVPCTNRRTSGKSKPDEVMTKPHLWEAWISVEEGLGEEKWTGMKPLSVSLDSPPELVPATPPRKSKPRLHLPSLRAVPLPLSSQLSDDTNTALEVAVLIVMPSPYHSPPSYRESVSPPPSPTSTLPPLSPLSPPSPSFSSIRSDAAASGTSLEEARPGGYVVGTCSVAYRGHTGGAN